MGFFGSVAKRVQAPFLRQP